MLLYPTAAGLQTFCKAFYLLMPENQNLPPDPTPIDPLTVGDLLTLKEAADLHNLNYDSLKDYARRGRLKAKKRGPIWFTTSTAIEEYLQSRHRGQRTDLIKKKDQNSAE